MPNSSLVSKKSSYATILITFDPAILPFSSNLNSSVYLDTSYGVIFVDKAWLAKMFFSQKISRILVLIKVRGIGASKYKLGKSTLAVFYIPGFDQENSDIYIYIRCKLYLIEDI